MSRARSCSVWQWRRIVVYALLHDYANAACVTYISEQHTADLQLVVFFCLVHIQWTKHVSCLVFFLFSQSSHPCMLILRAKIALKAVICIIGYIVFLIMDYSGTSGFIARFYRFMFKQISFNTKNKWLQKTRSK